MATNQWVIHTASGEFKFGGFYDPVPPDAEHSVVTLIGAYAEKMPDRRAQKYHRGAVVSRTAQEIVDYDATAPRLRAPELLIERMTAAEVNFFHATMDVNVRYLWFRLVGRNTPANVNSAAFKNGWANVVKPAGIAAGVWADAAAADVRLAAITT